MKNETNLNDVERFNAVDVLKVMEMIKKPNTNFDRITASPENLAEFIYCLIEACDYYAGNGARKISQYATEDTENKFHVELIHGNKDFGELLDWLNEEGTE